MKVLVLGTGKCGSTRLAYALRDYYGANLVIEPFNKEYNDNKPIVMPVLEENTIVKCILGTGQSGSVDQDLFEFFLEYSLQFDKTVLITRRDQAARLLSVLHAQHYNTWNPDEKYTMMPWTITPDKSYDDITSILESDKVLEAISSFMHIPIVYLEYLTSADREIAFKELTKIMMRNEEDSFDNMYDKHLDPRFKMNQNPYDKHGGIAQLGEHLLCKQGVVGSIPSVSTTLKVSFPYPKTHL